MVRRQDGGSVGTQARGAEFAFYEYPHAIVREWGVEHDYSRVHICVAEGLRSAR